MKRYYFFIFLLVLLPAVNIAISIQKLYPYIIKSPAGRSFAGLILSLPSDLICYFLFTIFSVILIFWILYLRTKNEGYTQNIKHLKNSNSSLREQVELLSVQRDLAKLGFEGASLEHILNEDLHILDRYFNEYLSKDYGLTELTEAVVFIIDDSTGDLIPHIQRKDGNVIMGQKIEIDQHVLERLMGVLEHRIIQASSEQACFYLSVPLIAEDYPQGILKCGFLMKEKAEDIGYIAKHVEAALQEVAKHIATAIGKDRLVKKSRIDGLTQLNTKGHFLNKIAQYFRDAKATRGRLSLIMIDIDHFKSVNDTHGHQSGDIVLREVAGCIMKIIRDKENAFRYGGEELAVILLNIDGKGALAVAERLRKRIHNSKFTSDSGSDIPVTISLGIGEYSHELACPEDLIVRADQALYYSKNNGRNRATVWQPEIAVKNGKV